MATTFDITPEKEGSPLRFFYRQLFFTPSEIHDVTLEGKTAIVTGSSSGVGLECSRQLLNLGLSRLILAVRNETKGAAASADLSKGRNLSDTTIEVWSLDYSSYDSVCAFGKRAKSLERLDIVVLNAGNLQIKQTINPNTGHDESVQVNYLSTALLTLLLLAVIKEKPNSQPARVTITSSDVAAWTKFNERNNNPLLSSLDKPDNWSGTDRQFLSKLLGQFFVAKLAPLVPPSMAVINMTTPGMVHDSEINRETKTLLSGRIADIIRRRIGYTSAVGARHVTDAAVKHGTETHGQYLSEQRLKPMAPMVYTPEGEIIKERLWKETIEEFSFADVEGIIKRLNI